MQRLTDGDVTVLKADLKLSLRWIRRQRRGKGSGQLAELLINMLDADELVCEDTSSETPSWRAAMDTQFATRHLSFTNEVAEGIAELFRDGSIEFCIRQGMQPDIEWSPTCQE
jgi:hypothetical protein